MNDENLRPCEYRLTQEEAKRGGIKSGEARRAKRRLKDIAIEVGSMLVKDKGVVDNLNKIADLPADQLTNDVAIVSIHTFKAICGDVQSANFIAKLRGELVDKAEVEAVVDTRQKEIEEAALKFFNRTE